MHDEDRFHIPPDLFINRDIVYPMTEELPASAWHVTPKMKELHARGIDGRGVIVGVNDTAGRADHPFLPKELAGRDFTGSRYGLEDKNGHGTHCCGIAKSVAPGISLCTAKVLGDSGSGSTQGINAGRVWLAKQGCDVISESLGDGGGPPVVADLQAYDQSYAAGVSICVAALGNAGYNGATTIGRPGSYASHNHGIAAIQSDWRSIAGFSSGGPQARFASPGAGIVSCKPGGGWVNMSGTCIAKGEYVYGPMGPKKIETIHPGDVVYAWKNGEMVERVVYQNHYRGTADTIVLNAEGRDVRCTPTHELLCFDSLGRDYAWVKAQDIQPERHRALLPRKFENQINPYLDSVLTDEFCWLLGFFAGDGWISYTTGGMRSCFADKGESKRSTLEEVARIYQATTGKTLSCNKNGNWHYDDSTMTAMVIECLGFNQPSQSKNFPLWLWNVSIAKQAAFYRGYCSSDGSRTKHGTMSFECTSRDLVRRLAIMHDYHGLGHGRCRSRERMLQAPNSPEAKMTTTHILYGSEKPIADGWSFLKTKSSSGCKRANGYGVDSSKFASAKFELIEDFETTDVYDLTVPDSDCFVTQGLITHNSMATPWQAGLYALIVGWRRSIGMADMVGAKAWADWLTLNGLTIDLGTPGWDPRFGNGLADPNKIFDFLLAKTSANV